MDQGTCRELLTADLAIELGVLSAVDAAMALARFREARELTILDGIRMPERGRVEAEVERILKEEGGDARLAVARRGVNREMGASLPPETSHTLSEEGARMRAPLRELDSERYVGFLPLGEGGMGVVYLALDSELNRRVAFKMIRSKTKTDPLAANSKDMPDDAIARFMQEAVVTGGLEHPGIVPVYEMGQTPAGAPYYTMRLIRGERTLDDAIHGAHVAEDRLALLEPFLKVCDAIRYAHSRGVIHRDLKPANIAIGDFGEVVVLDWGMAKMRDQPDLAGTRWKSRLEEMREETDLKTLTSAMGTPGYMAIEAALGESSKVDARSDVYSLGVILHRILTGKFPFAFTSFPEYVGRLLEGVTSVPDVPAGLAKVCLKAIARGREDRYQGAGELATAVRAWQTESAIDREVDSLSKEAEAALQTADGMEGDALLRQLDRAMGIGARIRELRPEHRGAEKVRDRARALRSRAMSQRESQARSRLLRRVGVAGLAAATAATILVAILLNGRRREAEDSRNREAAQRARAEGLASFMLHDLRDELRDVGRLDLLREVAQQSLAYYESLPSNELTDEDRRARGLALGNIGDVLQEMGDLASAAESFRQSRETFELLLAGDPGNATWQQDLSVSDNRIGDVRQETGDLAGALRSYEESVTMRRGLLERDPTNAAARDDLTRSLDRLGDVLTRMGNRESALRAYEEALAIRRELVRADPPNASWQRGLSMSLEKRGEIELKTADLGQALRSFEEALEIRQHLQERDPTSGERRHDVASCVFRIGYAQQQSGDSVAALERYREALGLFRGLVAQDPTNAWWQRDVSLSLERVADVLDEQGDRESALASYLEALEIKRRLAELDASGTRARHDVAVGLVNVGDVAKATGDLAAARDSYRESLEIALHLAEQHPKNTEWQRDVGIAHGRMGDVDLLKGEPEAARTAFREALAIYRRQAEADPMDASWRRDISLSLDRLGDISKAQGDLASATQTWIEAYEVKKRLTARDPTNQRWQKDLLHTLGRLGAACRETRDPAAARRFFEESVEIQRRLVERDPTNAARLRELALSLYNVGTSDESLGQDREALRFLREAWTVHRRAIEGAPAYAQEHHFWTDAYRRAVHAVGEDWLETADDHAMLAYALHEQKQYALAADQFEIAMRDDAIRADLQRGHLYNAACAAALADGPDAERWKRAALEWLSEDLRRRRDSLARVEDELRGGPPTSRAARLEKVRGGLLAHFEHARIGDPDLASLRDRAEFVALFE